MDSELFWGCLIAIFAWSAFCWYQVGTDRADLPGAVMWMAGGYALGTTVLFAVVVRGNDLEKISQSLAPFGGFGLVAAVAGVILGFWSGRESRTG